MKLSRVLFLAVAVLLSTGVNAATQYVDRPMPFPVHSGAPCFVPFLGNNLNAAHIRDINVDSRSVKEWVSGFPGKLRDKEAYLSLRVTFITGVHIETRSTDRAALVVQESQLLTAIRNCGK